MIKVHLTNLVLTLLTGVWWVERQSPFRRLIYYFIGVGILTSDFNFDRADRNETKIVILIAGLAVDVGKVCPGL